MIVPLVVSSVLLALAAGVLASVDAAVSSFSRARAHELIEENRGGAERLGRILDDPAPYLNTVLLLRVFCETASIVLVRSRGGQPHRRSVDADHGRGRDHGRGQLRR